jgi:hypothetical protein
MLTPENDPLHERVARELFGFEHAYGRYGILQIDKVKLPKSAPRAKGGWITSGKIELNREFSNQEDALKAGQALQRVFNRFDWGSEKLISKDVQATVVPDKTGTKMIEIPVDRLRTFPSVKIVRPEEGKLLVQVHLPADFAEKVMDHLEKCRAAGVAGYPR